MNTNDRTSRMKRVQVSFTLSQWKLIEKLKGVMGSTDSDVIRNIVLTWLTEKSFIVNEVKKEGKRK